MSGYNLTAHVPGRIAGTRGQGRKRTLYYGHCSCGAGTTTSSSPASAARKLRRHAEGDNRGMYRREQA